MEPGRRHYDSLAQETLAIVKKYGPIVGTLVMLGALGSCGLTIASAMGFSPNTTGTRLTAVESKIDTIKRDNIEIHSALATLILFQCGDTGLNLTQKQICARWERR